MRKKVMKWMKAAAVRAIKTMAQTAGATIGTAVVMSDVDWALVVSTSVLAGILSVISSMLGLPEVKEDGKNEQTD